MQVLETWVAPILSIIGMLGSLILFLLLRYSAKRERENIAAQIRFYREAKTNERMIDSLAYCHRLLQEGLRICDLVRHMPDPAPPSFVRELFDSSFRISDSLAGSSWMCGDLDDRIRKVGFVFQYTLVRDKSRKVVEVFEREARELSRDIETKIKGLLEQR